MSTSGQPLKLNYAKGRQKSKTKNQLESQQKIAFEGQSSTDIFSHLNQDNLNYIKKELKHKKAQKSQQKGKTFNYLSQEKNHLMKTKDHQKQLKIYDKVKHEDQVKQKNSKQELKKKEKQMQDSMLAQSIQETTAPEIQKRKQPKFFNEKQKNPYQGLQPPPLTYITKQRQIQNSQKSQKQEQKNYRLPNDFSRNSAYQSAKNNFLQYQLKSQTSNNQIGQSSIEEKQMSQNLSFHQKGSQFIGYLESYIEQLNGTAIKKIVKGKESVFKRQSSNKQAQRQMKNFRKNKQKDIQYQQVQSALSQQSLSHRPISVKKIQESRNFGFNQRKKNQRTSFLYNQTENQSPIEKNYDESFQELKNQLQKQKYYCTKLALELEKYKQNETKNKKQIVVLQKTIDLLKIQVDNVKQLYEKQSEQTKKILTFFQLQKQKEYQNKKRQQQRQDRKQRQMKMSQQKYYKQPQLNFRQPIKYFNQPYTRRSSIHRNQFEDFMRYNNDTQKTYHDLNPRLFNNLMDQFKRGQQAYIHEKQTARIKHSHPGNDYSRSQKYFDQEMSYQPKIKRHQKMEESSDKQINYLEKILKLNDRRDQSRRQKTSREYKKRINSSSSQQIQRQQSSLEKLKRQYELFKAQSKTVRFDDKKYNKKGSSLKNQISPKQFSEVYVK